MTVGTLMESTPFDESADNLSVEEWKMIGYLREAGINTLEKLESLTNPDVMRERITREMDMKLKEQSVGHQTGAQINSQKDAKNLQGPY
jgi:hypothetical protein